MLLLLSTLPGMGKLGKCVSGSFSEKGRRPTQEDRHFELPTFGAETGFAMGDYKLSCFGVFDGHGGPLCSEFISRHIPTVLLSEPTLMSDPCKALTMCFQKADDAYIQKAANDGHDDGSTAVVALIVNKMLYIANCGDSRAVLCRGGRAVALSSDHKATRTDERRRIHQAGGFVDFRGRLGGVLAVSRAFGDLMLKVNQSPRSGRLTKNNILIPTPEIKSEKLTDSDTFLILACDGVWDVMTSEEAVRVVDQTLRQGADPTNAAKALVSSALARGTMDNVTVVIIVFQ